MFDDPRLAAPLVIAEIGANHDGSVERAIALVDALVDRGVHCIKLQHYTAAELVSDPDRMVEWGPPGARAAEPVGAMFDRLSLGDDGFVRVVEHARARGAVPFATPFSIEGVEFLRSHGMPAIKIASSDVGYPDLLRAAGSAGVPVLLSTGKSTLEEVERAVATLREAGCDELAVLHCVAAYPTPIAESNVRALDTLRSLFPDCRIGFSDHSQGLDASRIALARGADIVERHVTWSRDAAGPDHWFSLEVEEIAELQAFAAAVEPALGTGDIGIAESERFGRLHGTRSLIAARALEPGDILDAAGIVVRRPGTGIAPVDLEKAIGMEVRVAVAAGEPITWDALGGTDAQASRAAEDS